MEILKKRVTAGLIILSLIPCAMAANPDTINIIDNAESNLAEQSEQVVLADIYNDNTLSSQLNKLYSDIGVTLGIPDTYVKAVHLIAGGEAIYSDRLPNIYTDETAKGLKAPFEIPGVMQVYDKEYNTNIEVPKEIQRPSKYYLPDAAYNVMSTIVAIMSDRYNVDRGQMQPYFNALKEDAKQNVVFYEALMVYLGYSNEQVDNLYKAYEKILYKKDKNEYVVECTESDGDTHYDICSKFTNIFNSYGITDTSKLAIAMSFDGLLAKNDNPDVLKTEVPLHYRVGYTSQENMMVAALSLIGKVRYVWGGGHGCSATIKGISPIWACFNELYSNRESDCIRPSNTWCPIHGAVGSSSDTCMIYDTQVSSIEEYLSLRGEYLSNTPSYSKLDGKNISDIFSNKFYPIEAHRLDGLDCSGFISWLYNQIDTSKTYDYMSSEFVSSGALQEVTCGEPLNPGDTVGWSSHVFLILGATDETNQIYIEVESTPSVVQLGVAYYNGATQEQIDNATQIAIEANKILGNIDDININTFNISSLCGRGADIGRLAKGFIDGADFGNKKAVDIIQTVIDELPFDYISGSNSYTGGIFNYVS